MKSIPLALVAALALAAAAAQAQTATQSGTTPPASAPAASSSGKPHLTHACKEEVKKQCGRAHGDEMKDCIKSSMDLNKFSDSCKSELQAKPSG
jgi:curli biogenesis system outer membrane secretion channel CsgG